MRSGTGRTQFTNTLGTCNWTHTGKGTYTRVFCQQNKGSVKTKQRPIKMDGRTIYRTLSPKRAPFQTGIDRGPTCERCLEKDKSATHILCHSETTAYLRFRHPGQFLMGPSDSMVPP
jgi:hypothetical protein